MASGLDELERIAEQAGVGVATMTSLRPRTDALRPSAFIRGMPAGAGRTASIQGIESTVGALAAERDSLFPHFDGDGPRLRVVEEIGKGGMGTVYKAVQTDLGREVAVKEATSSNEAAIAHFIAEARITGLIEHANVVPVHMLAVSPEGVPQIAMKLVKGESLRDRIQHGQHGTEELVGVLLSACNAVAYAHQRRIIHRDLKPENIMVGEFGQVFVLDWGIAAGLDEEMCRAHGILHVADCTGPAGTPAYMAPELARGRGEEQGLYTDIYLLGSCLHEILTGEARHLGDTVGEVVSEALLSEPFEYGDDVPWELAEIANKATAALPEERYQTVEELSDVLHGYVQHVSAHAIAAEGTRLLDELRDATAAFAAANEAERGALAVTIAEHQAEAQFAFRHALRIWAGTREAEQGRRACARLMLEHALATEDRALAERTLLEVDDDEARAKVKALRERAEAQGRELAELRDRARRLDWERIGPPLGRVFIFGGTLGSVTVLVTKQVIARQLPHSFAINAALWLTAAASIALFASRSLRGAHVPGSLASPRVLHTWGAVGLACLGVGLFNEFRPVKLSYDMCYPALLVGVGFVAMAMQTRRWLLLAAVPCYAGAAAIAFWPTAGYEVLAVMWLVVMSGVGLALTRGATLDDSR
jgi:predicted Ser/Thr protein kinase